MATTARRALKPDPQAEVFSALSKLFRAHLRQFEAMHDNEKVFYLQSKTATFRGKPMFFGGVRRGKAYVSVYFMPVYCYPEMIKTISPALKKRMQGKACFNFKTLEPDLMKELGKLIAAGAKKFGKVKNFEAVLQGRTYV